MDNSSFIIFDVTISDLYCYINYKAYNNSLVICGTIDKFYYPNIVLSDKSMLELKDFLLGKDVCSIDGWYNG